MGNTVNLKKLLYIITALSVGIIAIIVLRGPHVSNALKKIVLPELEMISGRKVIAQKISINILPLYIEAKDLKVFDETGQRLLTVARVKAYLDLAGIWNRTLSIRRLVVKEPQADTDQRQSEEIIQNVKSYLSKKRDDSIKVKVRAVEVQKGDIRFDFSDNKLFFDISDFNGEILTGETERVKADASKILIRREEWPEITADGSVAMQIQGDNLLIQEFTIGLLGSKMEASGNYQNNVAGIRAKADIVVSTIKEIFSLKKSGEGKVKLSGNLDYSDKKLSVNLAVDGSFYLETLMELLKVEEKVEGFIDIEGKIRGPISDLKAEAKGIMRKGNLFDVAIDKLACRISYANGIMRFAEAEGSIYNGRARATAAIHLPVVDHFDLDIDFSDADSKPLFELIGWDPGVPAGKVNGTLHTSGREFNPKGNFMYSGAGKGEDVLGRVKGIQGGYSLNQNLLSLTDIKIETGSTVLHISGDADIGKKSLNIAGRLKSSDMSDLLVPYYNGLHGSGEFAGKIQGSFGDPVISGRSFMPDAVISGYGAGALEADIIYSKKLLQVNSMRSSLRDESHSLKGTVKFAKAEELFDMRAPVYNLNASLKNADLGMFVKVFYPDFKGTGRLTSELNITGSEKIPEIRANSSVEKSSLFNVFFDKAFFDFSYASGRLDFRSAKIFRGDSSVHGNFTIYPDDSFSYKAISDKVKLSDLLQRQIQGDVAAILKSEGQGSFDNPTINLDAKITEGTLRGKKVGTGFIAATLRNREFAVKAGIIENKLTFDAKGRTDGEMPWEVSADIQTGRYDFLITSILKDIPEDLILNLSGSVSLKGNRHHISGSSLIKHIVLSMYGYSFSNLEEVRLNLNDRNLDLGNITLRSGNTILRLSGGLVFGKQYNISFEGSSALSPFKSLSNRLAVLKGDAEFTVSLSGDWNAPKINGGINLVNGSIGLKEYPHRISSLSGYLYMDNDRVILQKLSGKIGGGDIDISGILYLKKFVFSRFYVEARLSNIFTTISNDFSVNFGGNLLYKGTPTSQMISGDININRVKYKERVQWKSWLLQTKKIEKFKSEITDIEKAELNIKITGKENIFIDNNVARATLSSDMILRGSVHSPVLYGRLESREGTVYFRNNEFKILHASADFSDSKRINPVIGIAAETVVKGFKVKMNLEGQLENFNMSLSSDPPLKEIDILSLLTVGQTGGDLKGLQGNIGAGEAASFVTGKLQDVMEERLRSITGIDRFQVDPYVSKSPSKSTGAVEPRVTASKRLGEKIFVTYTSAVGSSEEQIVKIEYFLSNDISLIGVRDERGIVGGDLRFRFGFK